MSVTDEPKKEEAKPGWRQVARAVGRMLRWGLSTSPRALPGLFLLLVVSSLTPFFTSYLDSRVIDEIVRLLGLAADDRGLTALIQLIVAVVALNILERSLWIGIAVTEKISFFDISRALTLSFLRKASELDMYHYENAASNDVIQKAKDTYTWKPAAFLSRFGFHRDSWPVLEAALLSHARAGEVIGKRPSIYGRHYTVEGPLATPDGRNPIIRTAWVVAWGARRPRFVTAHPGRRSGGRQ